MLEAEIFAKVQPKEFLRRFVNSGTRPDGRGLNEARPLSIVPNVLSNASGSSQVRLGNTIVTCGIKLEVAEPSLSAPSRGFLVPNVDIPPVSHSKFRPGPPHELTQSVSYYLDDVIRKSMPLNLDELCISEKNAVWTAYADIICLNYDGNIYDAALLALVSALQTLRIPEAEYDQETGKVSVSLDKMYSLPLDRIPLSCSFGVFDGTCILLDPTDAEEQSLSSSICVTMDTSGEIYGILKQGGSAVPTETIMECLELALQRIKELSNEVSAKN